MIKKYVFSWKIVPKTLKRGNTLFQGKNIKIDKKKLQVCRFLKMWLKLYFVWYPSLDDTTIDKKVPVSRSGAAEPWTLHSAPFLGLQSDDAFLTNKKVYH